MRVCVYVRVAAGYMSVITGVGEGISTYVMNQDRSMALLGSFSKKKKNTGIM